MQPSRPQRRSDVHQSDCPKIYLKNDTHDLEAKKRNTLVFDIDKGEAVEASTNRTTVHGLKDGRGMKTQNYDEPKMKTSWSWCKHTRLALTFGRNSRIAYTQGLCTEESAQHSMLGTRPLRRGLCIMLRINTFDDNENQETRLVECFSSSLNLNRIDNSSYLLQCTIGKARPRESVNPSSTHRKIANGGSDE